MTRRGSSSAACSRSLIPDNASAIVADADAVNPRFTAGWLDYAQALRVRHRRRRGSARRKTSHGWNGPCSTCAATSSAGEDFTRPGGRPGRSPRLVRAHGRDADPRHDPGPARRRCSPSGRQGCCCRRPDRYDVPLFSVVKVHRDFHVEVGPGAVLGPDQLPGQTPATPAPTRRW